MALQGNLKDFELPEIFQLIASQQKTGLLRIDAPEESFAVHFSRGFIQIVEKNPDEPGTDFVTFLARCGVIKKRLAQEITKVAKKTSQPAYDLLLKEEVDAKSLKKAVWLYTLENMLEIVKLKKGEFQFLPRKVDLDPQIFEPLSADHVLMETYRIADELRKEVGKEFPWENVYQLNMERRDAFEEAKQLGFTGDALKLVLLVDGRRTLEDLAFRSGLGRLEALRAVRKLESAGVLTKVEKEEKEEKKKEKLSPTALLAQPQERALPFYLLVSLVFIIFALTLFARILSSSPNTVEISAPIHHRFSQIRLENALSLYTLVKGKPPDSLKELTQEHFISSRELTFPLEDIYYKNVVNVRDGKNYILLIPLKNEGR